MKNITIEDIMNELKIVREKIDMQESLLFQIVKQKIGKKVMRLETEVLRRGKMRSDEVEKYLGVTRTYALAKMKQLAKVPGFNYCKGGMGSPFPSVIDYSVKNMVKDGLKIVFKMFHAKDKILVKKVSGELFNNRFGYEEIMMVFNELKIRGYKREVSENGAYWSIPSTK